MKILLITRMVRWLELQRSRPRSVMWSRWGLLWIKSWCGDLTNLDGIAVKTVRTVRPDVVAGMPPHNNGQWTRPKSEREPDPLNDKGGGVLAAESAAGRPGMVHYSNGLCSDGAGSHYRREDEATGPLGTSTVKPNAPVNWRWSRATRVT